MLRVLTLNLWNDSGPWPARAERVRAWIERLAPDLIAFQEVVRGPARDLARELVGERYQLAFAKASDFWRAPGDEYGNAIASRWPIEKSDALPLPKKEGDAETRVALLAHIDSPHGPLRFCSTHLNWKFHHGMVRERQVAAVADFVRAQRVHRGFPAIIAGDFNAEPDSDEIRYMTGRHSIDGRSVYWNDAWLIAGRDSNGVTWSNRNAYARDRARARPAHRLRVRRLPAARRARARRVVPGRVRRRARGRLAERPLRRVRGSANGSALGAPPFAAMTHSGSAPRGERSIARSSVKPPASSR